MSVKNPELDRANAAFWNELCGTQLARSLGITDATPESLAAFDAAYLAYYPYLESYVSREPLSGKRVLEIGLGYGTLGQVLAERGADYHGLDISLGPVTMMRERLGRVGLSDPAERVRVGSALEVPHGAESFDYVYSIGCLHHTGDLQRSVEEIHRVLRPGGKAIVMVYNARSIRQLALPVLRRISRRWRSEGDELMRRTYDSDTSGEAAPHTDFVTTAEAWRIFGDFGKVNIDIRNISSLGYRRARIPRRLLLGNVARLVGTDLYVTAEK